MLRLGQEDLPAAPHPLQEAVLSPHLSTEFPKVDGLKAKTFQRLTWPEMIESTHIDAFAELC
jgi:hypothetical protein